MKHVVLVLALVACAPPPHVQLGPLPPNPRPHERVQWFEALHATSELTTITRTCSSGGGCSKSTTRELYLANGTTVHHPEDLLPVVGADSPTARSVRASQHARSKARTFTLAAVAGLVLATISFRQMVNNEGELSGAMKIGLYGGLGLAIIGAGGAYIYNDEAADEHGAANEHYNADLANQLRVCTKGLGIVPCEDQSSTGSGL